MEPITTPETGLDTKKRASAWGVFISLLLILCLIVGGAYYAFTKRYQPVAAHPAGETSTR